MRVRWQMSLPGFAGLRPVRRYGWRGHRHGVADDSLAVGAGRVSGGSLLGTPVRSDLQLRHSLRDRNVATPAARRPVALCMRSGSGMARRHRLGLSHGTCGSWIRAWGTAHRRGGTRQCHGYLHTLPSSARYLDSRAGARSVRSVPPPRETSMACCGTLEESVDRQFTLKKAG